MALVRNITTSVEIPGENITVIIRKLSHTQLKSASKARQSEGVSFMREMGGELLTALRDADSKKIDKIQEAQAASLSSYDRDILLKCGIVSWGYDAELPQGTDELDEPTADFLAKQIFEFSRPDTKEEAKNS